MNHLFHYHVCGFLAREAGFSHQEAIIVATSASLVDTAILPLPLELEDGSLHVMPCTHHYGYGGKGASIGAWLPFHFLPAGEGSGRDRWTVRPDSKAARQILVDALQTRDPYRVGIALHAYADTWAHQGFQGLRSSANVLDPSHPLPPIGHAQASRVPDITGLAWEDPRSPGKMISNGERFMDAARMIYRYLATYHRKSFSDWDRVSEGLATAMLPSVPWDMAPPWQDGLGKARSGLKSLGSRLQGLMGVEQPEDDAVPAFDVRRCGPRDSELEPILAIMSGLSPFDEGAWLKEALVPEDRPKAAVLARGIASKVLGLGQSAFRKNPDLFPFRLRAGPRFHESHLGRWARAAQDHRERAWALLGAYGLDPEDAARSMDV